MFGLFKSRQRQKAEAGNEINNEPVAEAETHKGKEKIKKREFFFLIVAFLLVFVASDFVHAFYDIRKDPLEKAAARQGMKPEDILANPELNERFFTEHVLDAVWHALISALFTVTSLFWAIVSLFITRGKCKSQTWTNIIGLSWPKAGPFMVWTGITLFLFTAGILFGLNSIWFVRELTFH